MERGAILKDRLEARLKELKTEFEAGQRVLADLEVQQTQTQKTLLRISGAIQVLEELLAEGSGVKADQMEQCIGVKEDTESNRKN